VRWLPRVHAASLTGRLRADRGLLLLMGLVVALTTALTAAVAPVTERTADRAIAATVHAAGPRSVVVATMPEWFDDPRGKTRDPATAVEVRQDADYALQSLPSGLADVLRPGITSVTTPALQLLDAGPGRYLQLAYVDTADGPPAVSYTRGGPPRGSVSDGRGDTGVGPGEEPWPVQVAVSEAVAQALDLQVDDRLPAKDEHGRAVVVRISGTFVPDDQDDDAWQVSTRLLHPAQGLADGLAYTSAAALVSSEALPDLRFALPGDDLTRRVSFTPEPSLLRWSEAASLEQSVVSLQASAGLARGDIAWDSTVGTVLRDGRAQVASARGQAQVLVVGLLGCAMLVLVLAAQLLVVRRSGPLAMVRQRGATLTGIAAELLLEAFLVAAVGAFLGLGVVRLLVGSAGWGWSLPVLVVAMTAAPVLGAGAAGADSGARRVPANRSARRTARRALRLRRLALESAVLAAAVLSLVALRQRGVVGEGAAGGDLLAASAPTWCAVSGAVVLLRLLPPTMRSVVRGARRSPGSVPFFVAARLTETGTRALPVLVACAAVAQISLGVAIAVTERQGQRAGALSAVGGDARLDADPDAALDLLARDVVGSPGVRAAVTGRVEDGVRVTSRHGAVVRLVVVDAAAYERMLEVSELADAPQLARLGPGSDRVPALLLGGSSDLREELVLRWEDASVPLDVVGTAPDVNASIEPVLVVDTRAIAGAGVVAPPDTIWAVGPGAGGALDSAAGRLATVDSVVRYVDELDRRRDAPLPSALLVLAVSSSALLLVLAILGTVLASAADAPARGESLGRLRALGLSQRDVRRVLVGELVAPVAVAGLAGLLLGIGCAYAVLGSLSLELVTGQPAPPVPVVPWWTALVVAVLLGSALVVAGLEWRRVRRRALADLLRS
jgi:putative ABC transport system permease protein